MKRRVTIEIDPALVDQAAKALGTSDPAETIRAALKETLERAAHGPLGARDLPDLTPDAVAEMRSLHRYPVTGEMTASEAIEEDRGAR